ncbi:MAG: hypothetical protein ACM3IH_09650 [Sphingobacteriales bacterium]
MIRQISFGISLGLCAAATQLAIASAATAKDLKVLSDKTIAGVGYAESVAYDPRGNVFDTGDFGPDLKPAERG